MADPVPDALEELRACAEATMAWNSALRATVAGLLDAVEAGDIADSEALRAELAVLERAQDRCIEALARIARWDIQNRLARLEAADEDLRNLFGNPGDEGDGS